MPRRALTIYGTVQGVGFRPFVYGLAHKLALSGFVRNQGTCVQIEIEGACSDLDRFTELVRIQSPPLARIDRIASEDRVPAGRSGFRIDTSERGAAHGGFIPPDVGTCDACLAELFDSNDRRYRYPFINCTHCGPRLTIVTSAPYDRQRTTMAHFAMCEQCCAEYENPGDRRFHAQPVACAACGPRLAAVTPTGVSGEGEAALTAFVAVIRRGGIGAMKGLGGYHLVCDARNAQAVAALRGRKRREEKPFAVMLPDLDAVRERCAVGKAEAEALTSLRRPIVLLRQHGATDITDAVAPGSPMLGVMLPYTPMHYLLIHDLEGMPLVMTSGNRSDEPIAFEDDRVAEQLDGIADIYLTHNRPIQIRCDDSVMRIVAGAPLPVRRSRGYAPEAIRLAVEGAHDAEPILAVGGQSKNTFALAEGGHVFVSQHMGDLDEYAAYRAFERDIGLYEKLVSIRPAVVAHDMHPDYASTRYARSRAASEALHRVPVQHHHAHMASCMIEHGLRGPVIGVIFDGTGYGEDGTIWGGEFLIGDCRACQRAAHLRGVPMPGGARAIREPWRMAAAHLFEAGESMTRLRGRLEARPLRAVAQMLHRYVNAPTTSSMGRLFDAVACLVTGRDRVSYEGQAATELERLAMMTGEACSPYPYELHAASPLEETDGFRSPWTVDTRPLIRALLHDMDQGEGSEQIAWRFHVTVAEMTVAACRALRSETAVNEVVLSGGVFLNALLTEQVTACLEAAAFHVYRHTLVPPGDGGLSLGQAGVAAAVTAGWR